LNQITESLNAPNTKVIENDYVGMAQDLRRMIAKLSRANLSVFISHWDRLNFLDNLSDFEDYCLDQPVRIIGDLIKDQVRSFNCYV